MEYLAKITDTPVERAQLTTLRKYEGILFEHFTVNGFCDGISPAGIFHRKRKNKSLLFCPYCLGNGTPYFRCSWRLSLLVVCPVCKVYLLDACPKCAALIIPFRMDLGRKNENAALSIKHCWNCFFDLSRSRTRKVEKKLLLFQQQIYQTINESLNNKTASALSYLKGVYFLASFLNRMNKKRNLKNARQFDFISLETKVKILSELSRLLEMWPDKFIREMKKKNYRFSDFAPEQKRKEQIPYWVYRVLYDNFFYGAFTNTKYHKSIDQRRK